MKIIFLDIDGVLITHRSMIAKVGRLFDAPSADADTLEMAQLHANDIDPVAVGLLNHAVRVTNSKIVVSSTHRIFAWRSGKCDLEQLKAYLQSFGVEGEVIGATPRLDNAPRGQEIEAWLDDHQVPSDVKFAIIDDDSDMLAWQMPFFVHTHFDAGLTFENWQKLVQILGAERELFT